MPTALTELIPMLEREINVPGAPQITTTGSQKLGYIEDGFWDARLAGMLASFTVADGADVTPVGTAGQRYFADHDTLTDDLDRQYWMMIVIFAGFRLLRLKIMQLAVNFSAKAGPVEYEQQASATVLRALLDNLQGRIQELKGQYSDEFGATVFILMDGVAQSEYAALNTLADAQVYY